MFSSILSYRNVFRILMAILIVSAIFGSYIFFYQAYFKLMHPYALNLGESPMSQVIDRFSQGLNPYRKLDSPPYSLVPYGPVFIFLSSLIGSMGENVFFSGRLVCLMASCLAALGIVTILRKSNVSNYVSVLCGFIFLGLPYVRSWGVQVNVDMTGIAFEVLAILFFIGWINEVANKKSYLLLGILFSTLAFFTKSSCIIAPTAFFLFLIIRRQYKEALIFAGLQGIVVTVILGTLIIVTKGEYFFHTIYEISQRKTFTAFIQLFWLKTLKLIPFIGVTIMATLLNPRVWKKHLYLCICLCLGVITTLSLSKQGSNTNYFLNICALSTIAAGLILQLILNSKKNIFIVITLVVLILHSWQQNPLNNSYHSFRYNLETEQKFYDQISKVVRKEKGPIISWFMSLLVANGKQIYFEPFPMAQMGYSGVWDESIIVRELSEKKFSLIMTYFMTPPLVGDRNFTPRFISALKQNYVIARRIQIPNADNKFMFFYTPRKDA